ncbi:hypothetical protein, partial [Flavobacterium sp.]|uniref:hypothetical protein n=1 Tax=Flavobacterium sp. TaxID=239 RepID=UPI0037BFAE4B
GVAKAGLGTTKALSGYAQFAGEVLGIDGMQESGKSVGAWARGKEEAVGEKGTFLERNLEGAINSIGQQLPLMIAGVQMETTALPLAGMAMQTFGQEYSDGRSVGQTPVEATQRAAVFAAFEVIGEKFGLGDSMKAIKAAAKGMPNDQIVGFLWSALKKEVPGELLTTTGQFATDKLPTIGLNQKATGEDYLKQVGDTIAQTIMQSGVMAGGTTGVSTAVRYLRDKSGNSTVDAIHAEDTKQRVLDRWNQGPLGVPRDQITPDGRIEPVTPPSQPAPDVVAAPTAPIDVHPTSAVADSIVADLATQAGVPHEFVLPAQKPAAIPNGDGIADQDALDFAEMRYRQLLTKRDGRVEQVATDAGLMDQEVPGAPLSEAETAELTALEAANGNPAAIRTIYQAPPTAEVQNSVLPEAKPIADVTLTDVGNTPVAAQEKIPRAEAPAEPIDVTGRTDQALQYLSTNGQPGWKEAAIAEIEKRAAQQPTPQGQFASADEATAYIGAQRRASSAKLPKALPLPFGDGTFGVVTEGKDGWNKALAYQKASAPKTEKEAKARQEAAPVAAEPVATTKKPKNEREAALARIAKGTAYFGTPEKAEAFIAKNKLNDTHTVEQTAKGRFEIKPITNQEQTNGNQAAETVETQAQKPQAPDTGAGEAVGKREFVEIKDLYGQSFRVMQSDLDGPRTRIPYFTKNGDRKGFVHRDNLDPTGQKKAALDAENAENPAFDVVTADQSKTFKTEAAAKAYATKNGYSDTHKAVPAADVQAGLSGYLLKRIEQPILREFAYKVKPTDGGFIVESDNGGGVVMSGRPNGPGLMNTVPPRVFKTEKAARDYMQKKGMADAEGQNDELDAEMRSYEAKAAEPKAATQLATVIDDRDNQKGQYIVRASDNTNLATFEIGRNGQPVRVKYFFEANETRSVADKAMADFNKERSAKIDKLYIEPEQKPVAEAVQQRFANNKVFTADKVEAARERLRAKLNQFNSGIDPEVIMDGMTIAGAYIESGVRKFSDYAKAMTADFGDKIKPYLLSFYEAARNYPGIDVEGMSSVDEAKAEHAAVIGTMSAQAKEEAKEAIGTPAEKPAKRTRKTGAKTDMTLTQDWGVAHIDGYGTEYNRETGNDTKDAFLKETKNYLNVVAGILTEQGYLPQSDNKGRAMKPVSVNESGMATSGDVTMTMYHPDGGGIYVSIGETSLRGMAPTTKSGIGIMFRAASEKNKYGQNSTNRWAPVDLSAADLAIMLDKESKAGIQVANPATQAILKSEDTQNDAQPNQIDAGSGAVEQQPVPARQPQGQEPTGTDLAADSGSGADVNRGSAERSNRIGDASKTADLYRESDGARADAEQPVQSSRGRSAGAGNRGSDRTRSGLSNYRISAGELQREGSWKTTAQRNVEIVELVKQIASENRQATPEEKAKLVKFTGWGASEVANGVFPDRYGRYKDASWQALGERLKAALTEEEYAQAKR